ncbi:MAG TPA: outer membrane lipoprotein carrier protein LolA [bacterium]|nr:outer membrane lipoprotein carrier protein LolA [bacterium]
MQQPKKLFFLFLILLFIPPSLRAEPSLAQRVESRYQNTRTWQASFVQTTFVDILKQKIKKSGMILVKKPDQLRIEYTSAPNKTYITDGHKLWIYKKDSLTAQQFGKPKDIISAEALSFMGGLKNLSQLFETLPPLNEPKVFVSIQNKSLQKIHLTPKDKNSAILKLTLGVDSRDLSIREAVIFNTSGNVTHYAFNNLIFDKDLADSEFALPPSPKRNIIKQ